MVWFERPVFQLFPLCSAKAAGSKLISRVLHPVSSSGGADGQRMCHTVEYYVAVKGVES